MNPKKMMILSDSNELEFVETKIINKVPILNYRYTKSQTKLSCILPLTNEQLGKMIANNIAKII
jgi:hypothetical protein